MQQNQNKYTYFRNRVEVDIDDSVEVPSDHFGDFLQFRKVKCTIRLHEHVQGDGRQIANSNLKIKN